MERERLYKYTFRSDKSDKKRKDGVTRALRAAIYRGESKEHNTLGMH